MSKHISALSSNSIQDKDLQNKVSQTLSSKSPSSIFKAPATINQLYSSYKHSPHSPESLLLKFAIHRLENHDAYKSANNIQSMAMDQAFLDHHKQGGAEKKLKDVNVDNLNYGLQKNIHILYHFHYNIFYIHLFVFSN